MESRRRKWILVAGVLGAVGLGFAALTGVSYAQWGTPFGWMGECRVSPGYAATGALAPLCLSDAETIAADYVASYGSSGFKIAAIAEFDDHFYIEVEEEDTGRYALELLVDRATGSVVPEPGPNRMWNLKYGQMSGGMMERPAVAAGDGSAMTLAAEDAADLAQAYLDRAGVEFDVDRRAAAFYGYYTMRVVHDGRTVGALSVNGYTGEVWPHSWLGRCWTLLDDGES